MMKRFVPLTFAIALLLAMATAVYAITIVVDGVKEATWDLGAPGQTPGSALDNNEVDVPDDSDIAEIKWTNDQNNLYILVDTVASPVQNSSSTLLICIDSDADPSTGSDTTSNWYTQCNSVTGFDIHVRVEKVLGTYQVVKYDQNGDNGQLIPGASHAFGDVLEVSIPLSEIFGQSGGTPNCPATFNTVFYFDNGQLAADDNTPDAGVIPMSCGSPTAITLESFGGTAASTHDSLLLVGALAGLFTLAGGWLVWRRR